MSNLSGKYCVIGDPIEHSISPQIHDFVFDFLKKDLEFTKEHILPGNLGNFVKDAKENGRPGFNVTIPHKQTIIPFLDEVDSVAASIGAVNTVHNQNGRLKGYNTDILGFTLGLKLADYTPEGDIVLIGAGGAARGVLAALDGMQAENVMVFDLVEEKIEHLISDMKSAVKMNITAGQQENLDETVKKARLLINATPVGMSPFVDAMPFLDPENIDDSMVVFDLVPQPVMTKLLKEAESRGAKVIPGLTMLIGQGLAADEIWLDHQFDKATYHHLINELIKRLGKDE